MAKNTPTNSTAAGADKDAEKPRNVLCRVKAKAHLFEDAQYAPGDEFTSTTERAAALGDLVEVVHVLGESKAAEEPPAE